MIGTTSKVESQETSRQNHYRFFFGGLTSDSTAVVIISLALTVRILIASFMGLGVDESYSVSVSRVPTWSFVDHPPLGFLLGRWAADLFASEAALVVRAPYLVLFTGASWLLYRITTYLFSKPAGIWALAWLSVAPFFLVSAGSWAVPDGPLLFFLLLAVWLIVPVFFEENPNAPNRRWLLAGAAFGLALLSKYHAILAGVGIVVFMATIPTARIWFLKPAFYAAMFIALLMFAPVIIWNSQHDWQSFSFHAARVIPQNYHSIEHALTNVTIMLLGQMLYLLPGTFIIGIWCLFTATKERNHDPRRWFCASLAIPSILAFNLLALFAHKSLPHWSMPGFIFVFPLIGYWIVRYWPGNLVYRLCQLYVTTACLIAILAIAGVTHVQSGFLTSWLYVQPPDWDNTIMAQDWKDLQRQFAKRGWLNDPTVVVAAKDWVQASKVDYALGGRLPVIVLSKDKRHFAHINPRPLGIDTTLFIVGLARLGRRLETERQLTNLVTPYGCKISRQQPIKLYRGLQHYHDLVVLRGRQCTAQIQ